MSIFDYDTDPSKNTLIGGLDIGEGCPPRNVNNVIRHIMADLADSSAKDPMKMRSGDDDNAISRGADGGMYIPTGSSVMMVPEELRSKDIGNLLGIGTDGLLWVDPDIGETVPWDSITDKPGTYSPSAHAATHGPGGSDPITTTNIPSGLIGCWSGSAASIPSGWALCNGQNGTPDLRDRMVICAGGGYAPGATGGSATHTVSGSTQAPSFGASFPTHSHGFDGSFTVTASPSSSGDKLCALIGYANPTTVMGVSTSDAGSGTMAHTHQYSATISGLPPYYALCIIMKL